MSSEAYRVGDVFWAPDPFREGTNPRLWLVLSADSLPYPGEEYICAALTTSDLPANVEVGDAWRSGRNPRKTSYCSPWVVATIKDRAVAEPQGRISESVTEGRSLRPSSLAVDDSQSSEPTGFPVDVLDVSIDDTGGRIATLRLLATDRPKEVGRSSAFDGSSTGAAVARYSLLLIGAEGNHR